MKKFILSLAIVMSMAMPFRALDLVSIGHYAADTKRATVLNNSYFDLSTGNFSQDWTNAGLITVNDNWSDVPGIQGFLGQDMTTTTGTDPQTILAGASIVANDLDVLANQSAPNTVSNGGVIEFDGIPNPSIAMNGSGTADAPHIVLYMNTTGRQSINIAYNVRDLDGSADNATQQVALQYRVGETGDFTNVPAGYIADATTQGTATQVTPISVTLPAAVNNQSQVQIRIMSTNAPSNDEAVGIDDIVVSSASAGGDPGSVQLSAATHSVDEGIPTLTVTATRTGGSDGAVGVSYATANGTATSGACGGASTTDYVAASGTLSWGAGDSSAKTFDITLCDDTEFEGNETFSVILSAATGGATLGVPNTALVTINETDAEPAAISFTTAAITEAESRSVHFELIRTGNTTGESTVALTTISNIGANQSPVCSFGADYIQQETVVTFPAGVTSVPYSIPICGDTFPDDSESFLAVLSNPIGAVLGSNSVVTVTIADSASQYRNVNVIDFEDNAQRSSSIEVSGQAGPIGTVRVSLFGVQHNNPADLDVLLVAPDGRQIILMSDAGAPVNTGVSVNTQPTLTFTDAASQVVPQSGPLTTGSFEPTSWTSGQPDFLPPAPAGPYNEPGSSVGGGPNLTSVFNGADANGTWTLYVRDDNGAAVKMGGLNGSMTGGWGIEFFTQTDAPISFSGKVVDSAGFPVRSAYIQLTSPDFPGTRTFVTNSFGRFTITGLQAGHLYSLSASSRRYVISPTITTFMPTGSLREVVFLALE